MEFNIMHTMNNAQYENQNQLRNSAKILLKKAGASDKEINSLIDKKIFPESKSNQIYHLNYANNFPHIMLNNSLCETLKYLNKQVSKKNKKRYTFGELWDSLDSLDFQAEYNELIDFEIDLSNTNIFAAA